MKIYDMKRNSVNTRAFKLTEFGHIEKCFNLSMNDECPIECVKVYDKDNKIMIIRYWAADVKTICYALEWIDTYYKRVSSQPWDEEKEEQK